jgi:hypothetical protein
MNKIFQKEITMTCKYLNQFRLSEFGWTVESCTANDRPYAPSISELHDYCKSNKLEKCPVLLKKEGIDVDMDGILIFEKLITAKL